MWGYQWPSVGKSVNREARGRRRGRDQHAACWCSFHKCLFSSSSSSLSNESKQSTPKCFRSWFSSRADETRFAHADKRVAGVIAMTLCRPRGTKRYPPSEFFTFFIRFCYPAFHQFPHVPSWPGCFISFASMNSRSEVRTYLLARINHSRSCTFSFLDTDDLLVGNQFVQ